MASEREKEGYGLSLTRAGEEDDLLMALLVMPPVVLCPGCPPYPGGSPVTTPRICSLSPPVRGLLAGQLVPLAGLGQGLGPQE